MPAQTFADQRRRPALRPARHICSHPHPASAVGAGGAALNRADPANSAEPGVADRAQRFGHTGQRTTAAALGIATTSNATAMLAEGQLTPRTFTRYSALADGAWLTTLRSVRSSAGGRQETTPTPRTRSTAQASMRAPKA